MNATLLASQVLGAWVVASSIPSDILTTLGVLSALSVGIIAVGYLFYHRLKKRNEQTLQGEALTLGGLRRMHKKGLLTQDEYVSAKAVIIAHSKHQLDIDHSKDPQNDDRSDIPP